MMKRVIVCLLTVLATLAFTSSNAAAQISIGAGVKGGLNGSLVSGVPEGDVHEINGGSYIADPDVYAMFGLGGAFGGVLEFRALDWIGLETGFHLSFDNGSGYEDLKAGGVKIARYNQKQTTTAWHIPVLLKMAVPFPAIQPVFGLGAEFVIQSDSELEYDAPGTKEIETSNYPLLLLSLGLEFKVSVVRIPLELRAGYNVGYDNAATERVEYSSTSSLTYDGAYQGHFGLFTGIIYDYDILF